MRRSIVSTVLGACALFLWFSGAAWAQQAPKAKDRTAVLAIMDQQENAWNSGDLVAFMNGYWRNDSLKFIGKSGVTYGWDATLARYQKGYPDQAAMGKLTFTIFHVEAIGKKAMLVVGKWFLQRAEDTPNGHFSLLWKKIKGEWVIVADHSS
ncbi:MAG: nuclear transport factor 2 family protein [Bacteroidota bacterium]